MAASRTCLAGVLIVCGAASAGATPSPTRTATPSAVSVHVIVSTVGADGFVPAAQVQVQVGGCFELGACPVESRVTNGNGQVDWYTDLLGSQGGVLFVGAATVSGTVLRGFGFSSYYSVTLDIDPISEAAVELLVG